ncbi:MAG TPA: hypothetical protein VGS21_09285, partial [Acidimicrobiales bacterium]|nr:hypothetical protein [Acidimicrobiales bacterium]
WSGVGHNMPVILPSRGSASCLAAALSSSTFDFAARQKVAGAHMTYFLLEQLPVPPPDRFSTPCPWAKRETIESWIKPRVLELSYSAWDMKPFAESLGDNGSPFLWNCERRLYLRAELDAAFFHIYGVARDDVEHIMGTFRVALNNNPALSQCVLAPYDSMATAMDRGVDFTSALKPPPGEGPRHEEGR